jgi:hypothetical protein
MSIQYPVSSIQYPVSSIQYPATATLAGTLENHKGTLPGRLDHKLQTRNPRRDTCTMTEIFVDVEVINFSVSFEYIERCSLETGHVNGEHRKILIRIQCIFIG